MGFLQTATKVGKSGFKIRSAVFWGFLLIWFAFIVINAIVVGFQERSFEPVLIDVGGRMAEPTFALQSQFQQIIDNEGVYDASKGKFKGTLSAAWTYISIISHLYTIFIWFALLMFFFGLVDSSRKLFSFMLSLFIFYIGQVLFILLINPTIGVLGALVVPFGVIIIFIKAIPYLIKPIQIVADQVIPEPNITFPNQSVVNNTIPEVNMTNISY